MNTQTIKATEIVLDENEIWMLASVMKDFWMNNLNRADRNDIRALWDKLRDEARKLSFDDLS